MHTYSGAIVVRNTDALPTGLFASDNGLQPNELAARTPDLLVEGDVTDMATLSAVRTVVLTDGTLLYIGQQALERFAWSRHGIPTGERELCDPPLVTEAEAGDVVEAEDLIPAVVEESKPVLSKVRAITGFGEDLILLLEVGNSLCLERLYLGHQIVNRIRKLTDHKGRNTKLRGCDPLPWNSYPCLDHAVFVPPSSEHDMLRMTGSRILHRDTGVELVLDTIPEEDRNTPVWVGIPNEPILQVTPLFNWNELPQTHPCLLYTSPSPRDS